MKIKRLEVWKEDLENKKPYTIAFKTIDTVESAFITIKAENGLTGIGACNPSEQVTGESLQDAYKSLQQEVGWLEGRPIETFEGLLLENTIRLPNNPGARAAVDMALHDLFTQYLNISLVKYLGQSIKALPTSVTVGILSVEETIADAEELVRSGFKVLKVKLGQNVQIDVERLVKLREKFGKVPVIRVDANQGYTRDELIWFFDQVRDLDIELIEQPLPKKDIAGMKALPEGIRESIAVDEAVQVSEDALVHVTPPVSSGIINIKLMKSGGIREARRIAAIAEAANINLMWGCNDESKVSITAAMHAAYSSPNTKYIDLDGSFDLTRDIVEGGFTMKNGMMYPLEAPGLGLKRI